MNDLNAEAEGLLIVPAYSYSLLCLAVRSVVEVLPGVQRDTLVV